MSLLSPVYFKELGQVAVSRKPVVMKSILAGVLLVATLIALWSFSGDDTNMSSGRFGQSLFMTIVFIELSAMALFTPVVTAGMVCGEREANTLGLLFLTRLKAWNIVQDKGLSRITLMLVLCAVTLPFMFTALLFGGVDPQQIVAAAGNILAVILLCGGLSLLFSTVARRYGAALAMSFSAVFIYLVVVPVFLVIAAETFHWSDSGLWVVAAINPFVSTGVSLSPYTARSNPGLVYTWSSNLLVGVVVYVSAVGIASRLLKRSAFPETGAGSAAGGRGTGKAFWKRTFPLHPAKWAHRGAEIGSNPVIWKESNLLSDNLKMVLFRISDLLFTIYLILMVCAFADAALGQEEMHLVGHAAAFVICSVFTAIVAACSFAREREAGTFDVLLATRLSGSDIVFGTFVGVCRSVIPFAAILLWILLIGVAATSPSWNPLFGVAIVIAVVGYIVPPFMRTFGVTTGRGPRLFQTGLFISGLLLATYASTATLGSKIGIGLPLVNIAVYFGFIIVVGMYMSLVCKTTAKAIGCTLGILLVLSLGIPLLGLIATEAMRSWHIGEFVIACSPDYWVAVAPTSQPFGNDFGGAAGYVAVTAAYGGVAFSLLVAMTNLFDQHVGRQNGGTATLRHPEGRPEQSTSG